MKKEMVNDDEKRLQASKRKVEDKFDIAKWVIPVAEGLKIEKRVLDAIKEYVLAYYRTDPDAIEKYIFPDDLKKYKDEFINVAKAMEPFGENDELYKALENVDGLEKLKKLSAAELLTQHLRAMAVKRLENGVNKLAKSIVVESADRKGDNLVINYSCAQMHDDPDSDIRVKKNLPLIFSNGKWYVRFKIDNSGHLERKLKEIDVYYKRKQKDRPGGVKSEASSLIPFKVYGYQNEYGDVIIEPRFKDADDFEEGLAPVKVFKKYGYINGKGDFVIEPQFSEARPFYEGLAVVGKYNEAAETRYGVISRKGEMIVQFIYEELNDFHDDLYAAKSGEFWGYINKNGDVVIDFKFIAADDFEGGMAEVEMEGESGVKTLLIDKKGNIEEEIQDNQPGFFTGKGGPHG